MDSSGVASLSSRVEELCSAEAREHVRNFGPVLGCSEG
jgi:hypothetical protein